MKKLFPLALSILLAASLAVGCATKPVSSSTPASEAASTETYNWRFAHEEVDGSVQDVYAKEFIKRLNEKSNGRINIDLYPVGQLGDATQQTELLQNGGLEFCMVSPGNTGTIVPENQLFSLHFLFTDDMEKNKEILKESKALNETLSAKYLEKNIKVLSYWTEGAMQWTSSGKALKSPADFKGFKMRTMPSPMIVAAYEAYGANPTPVPYMEVYSGLQLKMIEGQENPLFAIDEMKFYEVQDYLTMAGSNLYVTTTACNPKFFDGLPKDIQDMILETAEEMVDFAYETQKKLNDEAYNRIMNNSKIKTAELNQEEREAFRGASKAAYDKYASVVGAEGKAILDALIAEVKTYEK